MNPISIRLDPDLKAALDALAKADDRSLSAYINRALRDHVAAIQTLRDHVAAIQTKKQK